MRRLVLLLAVWLPLGAWAQGTPRSVVDELLATDRGFSAAGAAGMGVDAIGAMLHDSVEMRAGPVLARGKDQVLSTLRALPDLATAHTTWSPVRGGVSADGQHGFTFGTMTLTRPDGSKAFHKYLAYWVRTPTGWRVRLYRRAVRAGGEVAALPPALPPRMVAASTDATRLRRYAAEVDSSERAFSASARVIGLGAAFAKFGSADAMNIGAPDAPGFVLGSAEIGKFVGAGDPPGPSLLSWAPEHVIVASSGDLGATVGFIEIPAAGKRPAGRVPFFTIWRRATTRDPWRYVAE